MNKQILYNQKQLTFIGWPAGTYMETVYVHFGPGKTRETLVIEGPQDILLPEVPVNKYFIIYQVSKKRERTFAP